MPRKSPYEHGVDSHVRNGRPVINYRRGQGDKPESDPRPSRVVGDLGAVGPFDFTIFYTGEPREEFIVGGKNYKEVLGAGIEMREKPLPPKHIRMRKVR